MHVNNLGSFETVKVASSSKYQGDGAINKILAFYTKESPTGLLIWTAT